MGGRRTRKRKAGPRRKQTAKLSRARARSERLMKELASYRLKGGAMYSFNASEPIAVGAAAVGQADDGKFYDSSTGQPRVGGRRKTRKSRRRQRGGASGVSMGTTYASFTGTGERGIANYSQGVVQGNRF